MQPTTPQIAVCQFTLFRVRLSHPDASPHTPIQRYVIVKRHF